MLYVRLRMGINAVKTCWVLLNGWACPTCSKSRNCNSDHMNWLTTWNTILLLEMMMMYYLHASFQHSEFYFYWVWMSRPHLQLPKTITSFLLLCRICEVKWSEYIELRWQTVIFVVEIFTLLHAAVCQIRLWRFKSAWFLRQCCHMKTATYGC